MMQFKDKENINPSMCSTPIISKKGQRSFARTPLGKLDLNIKVKRSNPAELGLLKNYIEDLHTSYSTKLKDQKTELEESINKSRSLNTSDEQTQCDLSIGTMSEKTQIAILQKRLMKSNVARDKYENHVTALKKALKVMSEEREKFYTENQEIRREIVVLSESRICTGENCTSREYLMSEKQNYQILSNSHNELELQLCHLSTGMDKKNERISELFNENKDLQERQDDSNKRCTMYQTEISKLEKQLNKFETETQQYSNLRRDYDELRHNKSKIRNDMEFLLDERDTRDSALEEIYKQLTETRKELAALQDSNEELQQNYEVLSAKSETTLREHLKYKELVTDTSEMCDFLKKKLLPVLPALCDKHNVTYNEYQIQPSCPSLIGDVLFIMNGVDLLEDLAGSVSINKETRKHVVSLKEDKKVLEKTILDLKSSLTDQTERLKKRDVQQRVLTDTVVQYAQQIESNEEYLTKLFDQLKDMKLANNKLEVSNEKYLLQVSRQKEDLATTGEQLQMYDEVLHTVKTKMLSLGSSLPSTLKLVLKQLV